MHLGLSVSWGEGAAGPIKIPKQMGSFHRTLSEKNSHIIASSYLQKSDSVLDGWNDGVMYKQLSTAEPIKVNDVDSYEFEPCWQVSISAEASNRVSSCLNPNLSIGLMQNTRCFFGSSNWQAALQVAQQVGDEYRLCQNEGDGGALGRPRMIL